MLVGAVPIVGSQDAVPASAADATATAIAISATEKSLPIHAPFICGALQLMVNPSKLSHRCRTRNH